MSEGPHYSELVSTLRSLLKRVFQANCALDDAQATSYELLAIDRCTAKELLTNISNLFDRLLDWKSQTLHSEVAGLLEQTRGLEKCLQKAEQDVRNSHSTQNQLKLKVEELQLRLEELENKQIKQGTLPTIRDKDLVDKQLEENLLCIQQKEALLKKTLRANLELQDLLKAREAKIEELSKSHTDPKTTEQTPKQSYHLRISSNLMARLSGGPELELLRRYKTPIPARKELIIRSPKRNYVRNDSKGLPAQRFRNKKL